MQPINRRVVYTLLSALVIIGGSIAAIQYAKGKYRITDTGFVPGTGLLSATSLPTGAEVYIDDKLVTATDDTLYLEPNQYTIKIAKDGYTTWEKRIEIEQELVAQTNAKLFPIAPSLSTLTFTGAENIVPSPDGQKIAYYTASASAERKNGLYVLDLGNNPLSLQRGPRQIAADTSQVDLATARLIWSPDSSEILLLGEQRAVVLQAGQLNEITQLPDVSFSLRQLLSDWEKEMFLREQEFLSQFPDEMIAIATESAKNVYISPDKKRLLYTATAQVTIPDSIVPPLPATNTQPEERALQPGGIYVYDREEDKNFRLGTEASSSAVLNSTDDAAELINTGSKQLLSTELNNRTATDSALFQTLQATESGKLFQNFATYHSSLFANSYQWYPDSRHLLFIADNAIKIMEYDGQNRTTLYSGPFVNRFVYPWPDGSRLLIQTSFSPDTPANLYAIELD